MEDERGNRDTKDGNTEEVDGADEVNDDEGEEDDNVDDENDDTFLFPSTKDMCDGPATFDDMVRTGGGVLS